MNENRPKPNQKQVAGKNNRGSIAQARRGRNEGPRLASLSSFVLGSFEDAYLHLADLFDQAAQASTQTQINSTIQASVFFLCRSSISRLFFSAFFPLTFLLFLCMCERRGRGQRSSQRMTERKRENSQICYCYCQV